MGEKTSDRAKKLLRNTKNIGPVSVGITQEDIELVKKSGAKGEDARALIRTLLAGKLRHEEQRQDTALSFKDALGKDSEASEDPEST